MLPDLLHVLCGADCQLLNCLFQMFAADAESAERSQSVIFVWSACDSSTAGVYIFAAACP